MTAKQSGRRLAPVLAAVVAILAVGAAVPVGGTAPAPDDGVASVPHDAATGGTGPAQVQNPSGAEVLNRAVERYESAETIAGRAVVTTSNATETVRSNVSFADADPDRSRFVVERDGTTFRTGTNGTVSWTVGPQGAAVWDAGALGESPAERLPGEMSAVRFAVPTDLDPANASVELVGRTAVDGTPAYRLRVVPAGSDEPVRLWVGTEDYRVLRAVTVTGETRTVVDVTALWFDVSIHESTFQPPTDRIDAASFDRYDSFADVQSATEIDLPTLERGTFRTATVAVQDGETVVAQRYDLGGENVTLVSTTAADRFDRLTENATSVAVDGREANATTLDGRAAVVWTEGAVTTAVIVDGSTDRAVEVAGLVSAPEE